MTMAAVELQDVVVHAGRRRILLVDHLRGESGSLLALMGPNGSGKTTLLKVLLGLTSTTGGTVKVLGTDVARLRGGPLASLRRRIGYVPQLLPSRSELPLTVREVVAIGPTGRAGCFRPLSRADWSRVDTWIERLGLMALAECAYSDLSGGEQRKILLARAMAQEPELLLLDEPTANLDLGWRERIVETLEALYQGNRLTVLLVCHELEVLPPSCREVILLEEGAIAARGSPEALWTEPRVTRLYGAGLQVVHGRGRHAVIPGTAAEPADGPRFAVPPGGPHA